MLIVANKPNEHPLRRPCTSEYRLAADIGLLRIFTLGSYPNDPRMLWIGLVELAVMVAAAATLAPDVRGLSRRGSLEVAEPARQK
jgi:hypothetical protein